MAEPLETAAEAANGSIWTAAAIAGLLMLSAFFSGSETAMTAVSRAKLRRLADQGSTAARRVVGLTDDGETLIGAILIGNNIVNILATSLATSLALSLFGDSGVAIATLVMTVLVMIFAEVLPKTYAITNPEKVAARVAFPIRIVVLLFSPIVAMVRVLVRAILRSFGVETDPDSNILAVREEIAGALQLGHSEGFVEKEDRDRILGALDLNDRAVEEIMLHRSNIEVVDAALPPQEILSLILQSKYTRHPVYRDDPENIVGVIHAKDLLRAVHKLLTGDNAAEAIAKFDVMSVAMDPYFVPETTTLDDQMREFLRRRAHFALVVDEYGGLQGLITLEDILEEIVGEITDEFDEIDGNEIEACADGTYLIDGAMTIRDLNRAHDWSLPDEEANTVAGLVIHEAQMIPVEGQVFSFHGFRFEVVSKEENRIAEIKIRPL